MLNLKMNDQNQISEIFEKDDGLFDYIARKELDYSEPLRAGTPRGEKIGFSIQKYLASLFVGLTNIPLKKLAEDLNRKYGLSYGLLRKWRTEEDFKDAVQTQAEEFADFLIKRIRSWVLEEAELYAENPEITAGIWRIFEDARILSADVLERIFFKVMVVYREIKHIKGDEQLLEMVALYKVLQLIGLARGIRTPSYISLMADKAAISFVKDRLSSKRTLSEKERRMVLNCLDNIETHLGEIINDEKK